MSGGGAPDSQPHALSCRIGEGRCDRERGSITTRSGQPAGTDRQFLCRAISFDALPARRASTFPEGRTSPIMFDPERTRISQPNIGGDAYSFSAYSTPISWVRVLSPSDGWSGCFIKGDPLREWCGLNARPRASTVRELAPVGEDQPVRVGRDGRRMLSFTCWLLAMSTGYDATSNRCPCPAGHNRRYVTSVPSGSSHPP
jgi:hypothetical protein